MENFPPGERAEEDLGVCVVDPHVDEIADGDRADGIEDDDAVPFPLEQEERLAAFKGLQRVRDGEFLEG